MPSWGQDPVYDTGGPLVGVRFSDGWYNILTGMNYLPFNIELHKNRNIGAYDQHLQDNMDEADKFYDQLVLQQQRIGDMPSHYQYLKQGIYKGKD